MKKRADEAKKLKIPLMISEFGACYNTKVCEEEITQVVEESDKRLTHSHFHLLKQLKMDNLKYLLKNIC